MNFDKSLSQKFNVQNVKMMTQKVENELHKKIQ
jgi:hypothetical protein